MLEQIARQAKYAKKRKFYIFLKFHETPTSEGMADLTKRPRFEHVGEQVQFPLNCEIFGRRLDLFGACVVVDAHADLFSSGEAKAEGATAAVG